MESNAVECPTAERDVCDCGGGGAGAGCSCGGGSGGSGGGGGGGGPTLAILQEVQRCYEDRMALLERVGGTNKLQMQMEVLRCWVADLTGQNSLLVRCVQELEEDATNRLLLQLRRHAEAACEARAEAAALRRWLARKDADLRGLVEVLRRLREFDYCTLDGIHFFEVTESDIFGTPQWRQKTLENGDLKRNKLKEELNRLEGYRHFKVL